jgi:hypothetical protein
MAWVFAGRFGEARGNMRKKRKENMYSISSVLPRHVFDERGCQGVVERCSRVYLNPAVVLLSVCLRHCTAVLCLIRKEFCPCLLGLKPAL